MPAIGLVRPVVGAGPGFERGLKLRRRCSVDRIYKCINHFTIVESWENPAAAEAHAAAAHTKQYRLEIQPLSGSPLDERTFRGVE